MSDARRRSEERRANRARRRGDESPAREPRRGDEFLADSTATAAATGHGSGNGHRAGDAVTEVIDLPDRRGAAEVTADLAEKPRRRRRGRRIALIVALVVAVLGGGGFIGAGLYLHSVNSNIKRVNAFDAVPQESRPDKVVKDAMNLLILGSDTRDPENTSGSRSDTIIIAHLDAERSSAQLVSIPRDTWVHVPKSKNGRYGDVDAKINAAYAWGGIPLTVQTVENFTGVRIDHVAMVDFAGFKEIVDALDGVDLTVEEDFTSTHSLNANSLRTFHKGPQTMDGAAALDYARERYAFRDGDFARIRHQQQVIKAILDKASSAGVLTNPERLNGFLRATSNAVAVDETLNVFSMAMELRHLRSGNLAFYTSPNKGTGQMGTESVVLPDEERTKVFYDAVRRDATADLASLAQTG